MDSSQWQKMANLLFDMDKKVLSKDDNQPLQRIYDKMKLVIEETGIFIYNPKGENYNETRTDVEANISGSSTDNLFISDVIKPVIYLESNGKKTLLQKGIVIVQSR